MTPFTIIDKLTGPYSFSRTNKDSLNDKSELYFHDFSFVPLFMQVSWTLLSFEILRADIDQEHYLKTNPSATNQYEGPEKNFKHLELASKAADCISDGDLIDRMIHGCVSVVVTAESNQLTLRSEQHWSLLPLHAIQSTVAPAYHIYGPGRNTGGGGWGPAFPQ